MTAVLGHWSTSVSTSSFQREWWHILVSLIVLPKQTHYLNSLNPSKPAPQIKVIVFCWPDVCWNKVFKIKLKSKCYCQGVRVVVKGLLFAGASLFLPARDGDNATKAINSPWQRFWLEDSGDEGGKKGAPSCLCEMWFQGCSFADTWSCKANRKQSAIFFGHKCRIQHASHHGWWCVLLTALGTSERGDWCYMRGHVSPSMRFAVAGCALSQCVWPFLWGE